jgi:SAM-dependent methyltransferase
LDRWLVAPVLRGVIALRARVVDARFVYRQGLTPTVGGRIFKYPAIGLERVSRRVSAESQDLLFERYNLLNSLHYGPSGRGYQSTAAGSPAERVERYRAQTSRLAYFCDRFPEVLRYADGDRFLDLGCGTGQNIRFLAERFPSSSIVGADINADAIALVRECEPHDVLELRVGDIHDDDFLDVLLESPIDHVVMSHVFSLILGPSYEDTRALRQRVVDRLAVACRKSVIIIDTFGARNRMDIAIEQRQRGVVTDDVMGYFVPHSDGRTVLVQSDRTQAVMFFKGEAGVREL